MIDSPDCPYPPSLAKEFVENYSINPDCQGSEHGKDGFLFANWLQEVSNYDLSNSRQRFKAIDLLNERMPGSLELPNVMAVLGFLDSIAKRSQNRILRRQSQSIDRILNTCAKSVLSATGSNSVDWMVDACPNVVFKYLYPAVWDKNPERLAILRKVAL